MTADGRSGSGALTNGDINTLELEAIAQLLEALPQAQALEILVDSKAALDEISSIYLYRLMRWRRDGRPIRYASLLRRIDALLDGRSVRFHWVPGHEGIVLNEGAHRLAMLARRVDEAAGTLPVNEDTHAEMIGRISWEVTDALREVV